MTIVASHNKGKFKICDLFYSVNGDVDIQKKHLNGNGVYVITSGLDNKGIAGKSDISAMTIFDNSLTVDMFGNCFFRDFPYKMVTHARVFSLIPKSSFLSKEVGLYFEVLLSKYNKVYSYGDMCSWNKIKNDIVELPMRNGSIDFLQIEKFMKSIEEKTLHRVHNYFERNNLIDFALTKEEQIVLSVKPKTDTFVLSELFDITGTKGIDKPIFVEDGNSYNYVGRIGTNNMIRGKISYPGFEPNEPGTITSNVVGDKYVAYQSEPYYCSQNINKLTPKFKMSEKVALYFVAIIQKFVNQKQGEWNGFKLFEYENHSFELPVKNNGNLREIDFEYMEQYISAVEKLSMKKIIDDGSLL